MGREPGEAGMIDDDLTDEGIKKKQFAEIQRLRAENEKLRAALKPFADAADELEDYEKGSMSIWERPCATDITCDSLRAAAAAIRETE